ncbi:MAG: acetylornithine transaminase [Actinomycetota bacterium]|nr:acetylornithine transaminase [Actinomycetota bacterium]
MTDVPASNAPVTNLMGTYRRAPVRFVEGDGCVLVADDGRRYLDFLSGLAVTSLGHAHPGVAEAICAQARRLMHVSNLFDNELADEVAGTLDRLIGDGSPAGGKVFFANSGAEANECALKLARRFGGRGRHVVISGLGGFHGRTLATLHATGQPEKHEAFQPLPEGFRHVAYGDLDQVAAAADPAVVAGILVEAIQGEAGVVVPPPGYLRGLRQLCDERQILLMLDEVQTGLARTGRWFGFQHEGVQPDVVTMAKALGNGMPVGACWARAEVAEVFVAGDHGSTFGGQPLAMAAAKATLEALEAIEAPRQATERGAQLRDALGGLPGVTGVRGAGLLLGVMLEPGLSAPAIAAAALSAGLVINAPTPSLLRLAPPLIVSAAECEEAVSMIAALLSEAVAATTLGGSPR